MLVHCYTVIRPTVAVVARPFRRLTRHVAGSGLRKLRPSAGASAITVAEVCHRVPGALPAGAGAFAPTIIGTGLVGVALAGLFAVGGGGGPAVRHQDVTPSLASGLEPGSRGLITPDMPGELTPAFLNLPAAARPEAPGHPAPMPVPEPTALLLLALGGLGAVVVRQGRREAARSL